jgi:hypothetical protein
MNVFFGKDPNPKIKSGSLCCGESTSLGASSWPPYKHVETSPFPPAVQPHTVASNFLFSSLPPSPETSVFFLCFFVFFSFVQFCSIDKVVPEEKLAKFGDKPYMKIKIHKDPSVFLATLWNLY